MNKKRVVSTLFLYLSIFSLGCDFESPQKWETPSWYLPLTVPLINTVYSFEGMAQDSTIIEDSLNNTLKIVFSNNIVEDGGDRPGITDEIFDFKIPKTEQLDLFDSPPIDMPNLPPVKIGGESISIPVPIFAFSKKDVGSISDLCFSFSTIGPPITLAVGSFLIKLTKLDKPLSYLSVVERSFKTSSSLIISEAGGIFSLEGIIKSKKS